MSITPSVMKQLFLPLLILFIIINCFCFLFAPWLMEKRIDSNVVMAANLLLFSIGIVSGAMGIKAMNNPNPNVFIRNIMAGTFIKLMVIATAVLIYFFAAGENKSLFAILAGMALYIIYTIIEVKAAFNLNKKKDGRH